jgi:hypothetical protein
MQYPDKHTCNKRTKKQTLATYVYNPYNMGNILIYFCNIHMKHLQHTFETSKTLETYACNMCFQHNIYLLLGRLEARRCGAQCRRGGRCHGVLRSFGGEGRSAGEGG